MSGFESETTRWSESLKEIAFIAGSTGLTGRSVVETLRRIGIDTIAHVRPDSHRLEEWRTHFQSIGARVSTAAWNPESMRSELCQEMPTHVFGLLGTTKKKAAAGGGDYEAVDYGLTHCLFEAAQSIQPTPLCVYLSAAGVSENSRGAYYLARARIEQELSASTVRSLIARPSFILGDRDDYRPGEHYGAPIVDGLLSAVSFLGGRRWAGRYRSMSGEELAKGLVRLALDGHEGTCGVPELTKAAGELA